jgi:hypothetical protein
MESEFEEKKTMLTEIERLKQADLDRELEIKRLRDELAARDRQLLEVEERTKAAVAEAEERAKAAAAAAKKNEDSGSQIIAVPPRPRLSVNRPAADKTPPTTTPPPAILDEDAEKRGSMAFFKSMSQGVGKLLETEKAKFESERREREARERELGPDEVLAVRTRAIRADSILAEDEWIQKKTRVLSLEEMLDSDNEDDSSVDSDKQGGGPGQKQDEGDDDDDDDEADDDEEEGAIKQFYDEADTAKKEAGAEQREQAAEEVNLFDFIAEQGAALASEKVAAGDKKDRKSKKKRFATPSKMWPFASKKSAPSSPGSTITSLPPSPSPSPSPASGGGSTIVTTSSHGVPTRVPPPVPARAPSVHLASVSLSPSSSQEVLPVCTPAARPPEESSGDEESEDDVGDAELTDHLRDLRESNPDLTTRRTRASIMLFFGTTK